MNTDTAHFEHLPTYSEALVVLEALDTDSCMVSVAGFPEVWLKGWRTGPTVCLSTLTWVAGVHDCGLVELHVSGGFSASGLAALYARMETHECVLNSLIRATPGVDSVAPGLLCAPAWIANPTELSLAAQFLLAGMDPEPALDLARSWPTLSELSQEMPE